MINKLIPIIAPVSVFIAWEAIIASPKLFSSGLIAVAMILFILLLKLNNFKIKSKDFWLLSIPPFFFALFLTMFVLFLNSTFLQHFLVLVGAVSLYFYLRHFYNFLFQIARYKPLSLEGFSSYFSIISFLLFVISSYGLINFLNIKLYYLALAVIVASFILSYQFFWINKIDEQHNLFASILMSILAVEFFWSMSFFPISHFVVGFALAITYYVFTNLTLMHFLGKLDKRLVKIYISLGVFCVLIILLSAKWL